MSVAELDHSSPDADAGDAGVAMIEMVDAVVVPHDGPPAVPDMVDAGEGDGGAGPAVVEPPGGPPVGLDMADAGDVDGGGGVDVDGDADPAVVVPPGGPPAGGPPAGPGMAVVVHNPDHMPPGTKMMFVQVALIEAPGRIVSAEPSRIKVAALLGGSQDWSPHDRLHQILTVQRARFVFIVYCGIP
jgi:hypothetical protein